MSEHLTGNVLADKQFLEQTWLMINKSRGKLGQNSWTPRYMMITLRARRVTLMTVMMMRSPAHWRADLSASISASLTRIRACTIPRFNLSQGSILCNKSNDEKWAFLSERS